jgi:DNA-binding Lrp family transcriptional regulator
VSTAKGSSSLLDDIDRRLIELLVEDGRVSNRALAAAVDISEVAVASRLRRLMDRNVLSVTAVFDIESAGYRYAANASVWADNIDAVSAQLVEIGEVHVVARVLGGPDFLMEVRTVDMDAMASVLTDRVPSIPGVRATTARLVVEVVEERWHYARFTHPGSEPTFPNPSIPLDELDRAIIGELRRDGRQSNRRIASLLDVAPGTVRTRVVRLEQAGFMRIVAQVDPVALQEALVLSTLLLKTTGSPWPIARQLGALPEVLWSAVCLGDYNVSCLVSSPDSRELLDFVSACVHDLAGVADVDILYVTDALKGSFQLKPLRPSRGPQEREKRTL